MAGLTIKNLSDEEVSYHVIQDWDRTPYAYWSGGTLGPRREVFLQQSGACWGGGWNFYVLFTRLDGTTQASRTVKIDCCTSDSVEICNRVYDKKISMRTVVEKYVPGENKNVVFSSEDVLEVEATTGGEHVKKYKVVRKDDGVHVEFKGEVQANADFGPPRPRP